MRKTTVSCARCGRTILPYRSVLPSNEAMDVCGECALDVGHDPIVVRITVDAPNYVGSAKDLEVALLEAVRRGGLKKVLRAAGVEI